MPPMTPVPAHIVQVVFLKYDGRPHRSYPARWLGEDVPSRLRDSVRVPVTVVTQEG